jgi:hypothetical protein
MLGLYKKVPTLFWTQVEGGTFKFLNSESKASKGINFSMIFGLESRAKVSQNKNHL